MGKISRVLSLFVSVFVALVVSGCNDVEKPAPKPPLVKTMVVDMGVGNSENVYSGATCGRYESNLSFQVGGRVLARNVQAGSFVRAGDILMTLDTKDVVEKANQGDAQVASALAQLELAKANLARYQELYNEDAIATSVLDQYQTNYNVALAAYENAKAQAAEGHNALSYANLVANADGVISAVYAEEGQVVAAGQTALILTQTEEIEVEIQVPENHLQEVGIGTEAKVTFWATPESVLGVVREVSPMASAASRTYTVRISLLQPPKNLQLGMTASATLLNANFAKNKDLCSIPLSAVYQTGNHTQVWVVDDKNTVKLKNIEVTEFGDNQVTVKGLLQGECVVTAGAHSLREGQEVRVGDAS